MRCVQTSHLMHSGLRARTDQRHAPVAVLLHLKALPAALAVLHPAHMAGLCPPPRWGRPQCSLPRELDNRRPKALRRSAPHKADFDGLAGPHFGLSSLKPHKAARGPHCCRAGWPSAGRRAFGGACSSVRSLASFALSWPRWYSVACRRFASAFSTSRDVRATGPASRRCSSACPAKLPAGLLAGWPAGGGAGLCLPAALPHCCAWRWCRQ